MLTGRQVLALRLRSLLLRQPPAGAPDLAGDRAGNPGGVAAVAEWFGAMQAQDYSSILWSLGRRLPGWTIADVEAALERGEAVRTWPMRGTIHLVPARDVRWLVELAAARPLAQAARRRQQLGISDGTPDRAVDVLGSALAGGRRLTRAQCVETFARAGLPVDGPRAYHLLAYACQRAVTCLGPNAGREQTVVLLDEWLPDQRRPERDEALALLARRYVRSHGPVTRQDFARWTGLAAADVTRALAGAADDGESDGLATATYDGREVYLATGSLDALDSEAAALGPEDGPGGDVAEHPGPVDGARPETRGARFDALSGFDEYLLGYRDRSLMANPDQLRAIVPGGNGVFRWTITRGGRVVATWLRTTRASGSQPRVDVTMHPLADLGDPERSAAEAALAPYGHFTGLPLQVTWH